MTDLLLDPAIRSWVFVPIILITFLVGIIRHYVYLLLLNKKKGDLQNVKDSHYLAKARLLRENGRFLPPTTFGMRKYFLNDEENGYLLKRVEKQTAQPNAFDPSMMTEMLKGNMLNMIPMIFIGGWINWTFSGFVTTRVPFPLTLRFKPMLQRGVDLLSLDAAWVSSASWYFLNVFGLRSIYNLVLGGENVADTMMDEQMAMQGAGGPQAPPDPEQAFKAEWEALQLYCHSFQV
ncbi:Protein EMC-3 [Aphelenchoides avenae]|nr:Protein EMC-3 [Aphelenchus avenae]